MSSKIVLPLVLAAGLAACSSSGGSWVKAGVSEDQVRVDRVSCRQSAERATARNDAVTRDIRSSIPGGRADTRAFVEDTRDLRAAKSFERLFAQCMRGLGYTRPKS